jgi:hypothetical protein
MTARKSGVREGDGEGAGGRESKAAPSKIVLELSSRGKRYRIDSLFTRSPEFDELDYFYASEKKKRVEQPQD